MGLVRRRGTNYIQEDNFILKFCHQDLLPGDILGEDRSTAEPEQCQGVPVFGCPCDLTWKRS